MKKKFKNIACEIRKSNKEIKNNAPYSDDLNNYWIGEKEIIWEINNLFYKEFFSEIDVIWESFEKIFSINWDVRKSFEKIIWNIIWKDISSKDFDKIFSLDFKKRSWGLTKEDFLEKIISLENNAKDREELEYDKKFKISLEEKENLWKIFNELTKNKEFKNFIFENFNSNEEFLEEFSKISWNLKKASLDKDLEFNQLWSLSDWKIKKWIEFYKNFNFSKFFIFWWIFTWTVSWDIYALSRFISPESDLASWFVDIFNKIWENYASWLIDWYDIALWSSFWITDLTFKILFLRWFYKNTSSTKKIWFKDYLKWAALFWWMSVAIFTAWWLQWVSAWYTANSENEKIKVIDASARWEGKKYNINKNSTVLKIQKEWFKKDLSDVVNWLTKTADYLPWMFWSYYDFLFKWWKIDNTHNYQKKLLELKSDLTSWKLDNIWSLWELNKDIKNVKEYADLSKKYKSLFENLVIEIEWKSSSWKTLFWSIAREKTEIILKFTWYLKWKTIEDQLIVFIKDIYKDDIEKRDAYIKEIKSWIKNNHWFYNLWKLEMSSNISLKTIHDTYLNWNIEKIRWFEKEIKDFILNINEQNVDEIKISELNKIFKEYNDFKSGILINDSANYNQAINSIGKDIVKKLKDIDEKYKNVEKYKEASIREKKLTLTDNLKPLPERYAEFDDFISDIKEWIELFNNTWELRPSIISFVNYFSWFVMWNFTDIAIILFLIWYSRKRWKRKVKNWKIFNQKELLEYRDEKFLKVKEEILKSMDEIWKIFTEKWVELKNSWINKKQLEKFSEFVENYWIYKEWENLYWYNKKTSKAQSKYEFFWWKMNNLSSIGGLNNLNYKDYWENDSIFVSNLIKWLNSKIWIINNKDWWFTIELNPWEKVDHYIDLSEDKIDQIIKEWWLLDEWNFKWLFWKQMVWLLITKEWFILMPYDKNNKNKIINLSSLTRWDLLKYINN